MKSPLRAKRPPKPRVRNLAGGRRFITEGLEHSLFGDFYFQAMTATWPVFVGGLATAFFALNVVFATVYMLGDAPIANAAPHSFADLFFFSVETTSTVGYGDMHPQTTYGHLIATVENFVGLVLLSAMTGLVFSRFSRPRARLIFARNPVVFAHDGLQTLAIRIGNARNSFISEATATLWMLGPMTTKESRRYVGFVPMKLTKSENPIFALTWTLFHPIDESSPLFGLEPDEIEATELNFVLSISGYDETSAQSVRARATYTAQDLRFDHEFVDVFSLDADGTRRVDYSRIHDVRAISELQDST
jgi:inward rectifier potassium channel